MLNVVGVHARVIFLGCLCLLFVVYMLLLCMHYPCLLFVGLLMDCIIFVVERFCVGVYLLCLYAIHCAFAIVAAICYGLLFLYVCRVLCTCCDFCYFRLLSVGCLIICCLGLMVALNAGVCLRMR